MNTQERFDNHECRIVNLELSDATLKERVSNLVKKMDTLISAIIALIVAMTGYVIWGG